MKENETYFVDIFLHWAWKIKDKLKSLQNAKNFSNGVDFFLSFN